MFFPSLISLFVALAMAKLQEPQGQVIINAVNANKQQQQKPQPEEKGLSSDNAICHRSVNPNQPPQGIRVNGSTPGIYKFDFTNRRADAFQYFSLTVEDDEKVRVEAWDCFCAGDTFEIFNGSVSLFVTEGGWDLKCRLHDKNPGYCYSNSGPDSFSYGYVDLNPGEYVIRISNINTPYVSGTGFIAFRDLCGDSPCCDEDGCDVNTILNKPRHQPHWDCHECHRHDHGCQGKENF